MFLYSYLYDEEVLYHCMTNILQTIFIYEYPKRKQILNILLININV